MNKSQSRSAIGGSALLVGGLYLYRHLVSSDQKHPPASVHKFIVAWGFTYLVLALAGEMAPSFAGYMAILIAIGAMIYEGEPIFRDVISVSNGTSPSNTSSSQPPASKSIVI